MSDGLNPGMHPDPDALNSFVEGALPEHQRMECLAHLAECGECREVVFLARRAAEIEEPVAITDTPVPFWQRLLRPKVVMSVVAMVVVAVFSFGLYRMIRSTEPQPRVTESTKAPMETAPTAKAVEQTPELQSRTSQPTPTQVNPRPAPKKQEQQGAPPAPAPAAAAPPVIPPPEVASALPPPPTPSVATADGAVVQLAEEAGVVGTIVDPAGAAISSVRVEVKNEDTGATYTSTSDARGHYSIAGLPPGQYDFNATSPGFKKFVRTGVNVQPQEMARLDSKLDVGSALESVTVTAEASMLKTESGELSHAADSTSLNQLPLSTRARGNVQAVSDASRRYTLPDKSPPVSVAIKGKLVVAVDTAGAVLVSENAGKNWTRVKATWKGKVVRVAMSANAMFELTTDSASTWVSTDGRHWSASR